ncbi:MAG TPA: transposase [Candidatus Moranbacteria bacterium]|nr:transposase [Candidatus Moranbacteria bacterium]
MVLDLFGKIIDYHWRKLPRHFKNIVLDEYQIMPNHFHGIIHIVGAMHSDLNNQKNNENFNGNVGAMHSDLDNQKNNEKFNGNASPLSQPRRPHGTVPGSLGAIMQNFQSVTTRKINRIRKTPGARLWQRNYWEHIIRNETELNRIRNYIINNPKNWDEDRFSF